MKIGKELRSEMKRKPVNRVNENKPNFNHLVQAKSDRLANEQLNRLLGDITDQGKRIARFRSLRDLAKFKRMIREFLQETVYNGLKLKEIHSFNTESFSHKLTTVEAIDEKLIQLTDDLIDQEKQTVDILGIIGEIEGLLVNLYT